MADDPMHQNLDAAGRRRKVGRQNQKSNVGGNVVASPLAGAGTYINSSSLAPSVALVHDYLLIMRGAERTFAAIAECWPDAPIFTLLYDSDRTEGAFAHRTVQTSYLERLRIRQSGFRRLLPFFPRAAERLPIQDYELIVSSTSAFAHGVRPRPGAVHVAYCHTPFRYAWHERDGALGTLPSPLRPLVRHTLSRIRHWDLDASQRVTHYVANSEVTRQRIRDCYGRDATIVHPPVEVERFSLGEPEDYFLVVTEIVPHKRVANALEAARRAGCRIKIVGSGPDLRRLSREYDSSADFLGRVPDGKLADLYRRARAVVVPNVEEFGIAAVEAQASGRPVLATDAGGARETVVTGATGVLVPPEDVDALAQAMREVDWAGFDQARIREHAMGFSRDEFKRRFSAEVARVSGVASASV
jgi:glycosyltransferase involved in cell wall biosynthesis